MKGVGGGVGGGVKVRLKTFFNVDYVDVTKKGILKSFNDTSNA